MSAQPTQLPITSAKHDLSATVPLLCTAAVHNLSLRLPLLTHSTTPVSCCFHFATDSISFYPSLSYPSKHSLVLCHIPTSSTPARSSPPPPPAAMHTVRYASTEHSSVPVYNSKGEVLTAGVVQHTTQLPETNLPSKVVLLDTRIASKQGASYQQQQTIDKEALNLQPVRAYETKGDERMHSDESRC